MDWVVGIEKHRHRQPTFLEEKSSEKSGLFLYSGACLTTTLMGT
jgi:hypothetical protein